MTNVMCGIDGLSRPFSVYEDYKPSTSPQGVALGFYVCGLSGHHVETPVADRTVCATQRGHLFTVLRSFNDVA